MPTEADLAGTVDDMESVAKKGSQIATDLGVPVVQPMCSGVVAMSLELERPAETARFVLLFDQKNGEAFAVGVIRRRQAGRPATQDDDGLLYVVRHDWRVLSPRSASVFGPSAFRCFPGVSTSRRPPQRSSRRASEEDTGECRVLPAGPKANLRSLPARLIRWGSLGVSGGVVKPRGARRRITRLRELLPPSCTG